MTYKPNNMVSQWHIGYRLTDIDVTSDWVKYASDEKPPTVNINKGSEFYCKVTLP